MPTHDNIAAAYNALPANIKAILTEAQFRTAVGIQGTGPEAIQQVVDFYTAYATGNPIGGGLDPTGPVNPDISPGFPFWGEGGDAVPPGGAIGGFEPGEIFPYTDPAGWLARLNQQGITGGGPVAQYARGPGQQRALDLWMLKGFTGGQPGNVGEFYDAPTQFGNYGQKFRDFLGAEQTPFLTSTLESRGGQELASKLAVGGLPGFLRGFAQGEHKNVAAQFRAGGGQGDFRDYLKSYYGY